MAEAAVSAGLVIFLLVVRKMSQLWSSWACFVALVAAALANVVTAVGFEFSCQAPTNFVRMMYMFDLSPGMSDFLGNTLQGGSGAINTFDTFVRGEFTLSAVGGVSYFTQKQIETGDLDDKCYFTSVPFADAAVSPGVDALSTVGSATSSESSILDALYQVAQIDWNNPSASGRPFLYVFTNSLPSTNSPLPAFAGGNCEMENYPSFGQAQAALDALFLTVAFFVPNDLVAAYASLFPDNLVVPMSSDPAIMAERMFGVYDHIWCDTPLPTASPTTTTTPPPTTTTPPPTTTTPPPTTTTPPPTTTTIPKPCDGQAQLQLLHVQDGSSSYANDVATVTNLYTALFPMLTNQLVSYEVAVTSFSDKPVAPVGWPNWDYCYAEDQVFTNVDADILAAQSNVQIKSGRDWKESQYDAIYEGVKSPNLGWNVGEFNGPNPVLKIVVLATDAGPHVGGDVALPWDPAMPCNARDYPSTAQLAALLDQENIYPIFYVTDDIENYWKGKASDIPSKNPPTVISTDESPSFVYSKIVDALEDFCENIDSCRATGRC